MITGTKKFEKILNTRYCAEFGVDYFKSEMRIDLEHLSVKRTEIKYTTFLFFFKFYSEHVKHFYPWQYTWKTNGNEWKIILEPIIKKTVKGEDVLYDLDVQEMRKRVHTLIQTKKEK
ncbi:MAG: hypothetical protein GY797_38950 [Deltaproteobacteria bacterium]|nr:hypothetical protein [Deltaproteobacteria bacterium]